MAGRREKQIAVLDGIYYRMGASLETDGITFSAAVPAGEAASLLLYRKGQTDRSRSAGYFKSTRRRLCWHGCKYDR